LSRKINVNKKEMHSIVKLLSLISFLLLSFQATSQTAITSSGDTLVYLPSKTARQVIVDLERGDLCNKELESYLIDIASLNEAIQAKDGQIANFESVKTNLNAIAKEKNTQITKKDEYISYLKKAKRMNLIKGWLSGAALGALITVILTI
tara:strand:+ start:10374 stop:10823 length:450 start_codon:yes stop_codon:yes gene_type:complete